jgi:anti-sigma B factor antagonist
VLEIKVEASDEGEGHHLCRLTGEVDAYTVGDFREALASINDVRWLIIDLSGVPFMDSAGLGALIGGIRRVREGEGDVAVVSTTASLNRLLHTTGFDRIVPVTESLEEALAALAEA